jgi:hypothetical protein
MTDGGLGCLGRYSGTDSEMILPARSPAGKQPSTAARTIRNLKQEIKSRDLIAELVRRGIVERTARQIARDLAAGSSILSTLG